MDKDIQNNPLISNLAGVIRFISANLQKTTSNKKITSETINLSYLTQEKRQLEEKIGQKQNRQDIVSITYEEIGFFPRSFSRVLDRFLKQVFSDVENLVIQEYRFYRYLFLTTLKCVLILFFVPFLVNYLAKTYLVSPLTEYFWNTQQTEIFLNSYQQKRAFTELKDFEEKLYFESLINSGSKTNKFEEVTNQNFEYSQLYSPFYKAEGRILTFCKAEGLEIAESLKDISNSDYCGGIKNTSRFFEPDCSFILANKPENELSQQNTLEKQLNKSELNTTNMTKNLFVQNIQTNTIPKENTKNLWPIKNGVIQKSFSIKNRQEIFEKRLQEKTFELANRYNHQSIEAITNFFADLLSFITLCYLLIILEIQINITKSFLLEVFFGLDDGKKSLFILLITDLLVGYHSSNLWELFFEFLFNHYGLPESQTGIFLLVATLPVLLDVLFKYLIFRHLNRSSPATVATYHAIIE